VLGTVHLDPARKHTDLVPRRHGPWTAPMPWWAFIWTLTQRMGEKAYRRSERRKAMAKAMASGNSSASARLP